MSMVAPAIGALPARYLLQLSNQVKSPAFTSNPVHAIHVAIYDTHTRSYISSECFRSSAKIRLIVLSDELWVNKGENWSRGDFNESLLRAREGKGPILKDRNLTIRLVNGLITIENIIFNDNSSWTRSGFRLGIVVEGEGEEGYLNRERVREGVSKAFRVLDRHGKVTQKPDLLMLTHGVQSLKKVGKDRASLLQRNNIKTVEDFLCWYNNNELELRKILGIKSEYDKGWKSMIEHAMQCANEFYAKYKTLKSSMSNSGYVGPLSPHKMGNIKIVLKFIITVLAGPRSRTRIVPPAIYNTMENTSQPQQDLFHLNGGPLVVGSSSLEPNSFENNNIEGDILRQLDADYAYYIELISNSGEHTVEAQPALFHETNVSPLECLDWIEDQYGNESEHTSIARGNIVNSNSMQNITGNGLAQLQIPDIPENLQLNTESTSLSTCDSSDFFASILNSECENEGQQIISEPYSSLVNGEDVEPLTPRRKRKMMAHVRSITFVAVLRKRARMVPPANQMTVPAI
ncbi:uncharacterized protein LOC144575331 [Carex rostrata]